MSQSSRRSPPRVGSGEEICTDAATDVGADSRDDAGLEPGVVSGAPSGPDLGAGSMARLGSEALLGRYAAAFASTDIESMMALWEDTPEIVCIHPNSTRPHHGVAEVMESWLMVFSRPLDVKIERRVVSRCEACGMVAMVWEESVTRPGDPMPSGTLLVTQIWRKIGDTMRLYHHHASHGRRPNGPAPTSTAVAGSRSVRH